MAKVEFKNWIRHIPNEAELTGLLSRANEALMKAQQDVVFFQQCLGLSRAMALPDDPPDEPAQDEQLPKKRGRHPNCFGDPDAFNPTDEKCTGCRWREPECAAAVAKKVASEAEALPSEPAEGA